MTKKGHRKPAAFRVEEVELFVPPVAPEVSAEATPLPARLRTLPDLSRGLRWGSILVGALGGLIGLLASIWLYDYVLALLARDDWIGWLAVGLNERLRFYRYDTGQRFFWHFDGPFERSPTEVSALTFMVYLNDGCEGGETEFNFRPVGGITDDDPVVRVTPEPGKALVFNHRILHQGAAVRSGRRNGSSSSPTASAASSIISAREPPAPICKRSMTGPSTTFLSRSPMSRSGRSSTLPTSMKGCSQQPRPSAPP